MNYSIIKKLSLFFFVLGATLSVQASTHYATNISMQEDSVKSTPTVCYEVFGMDCPGCESALEKQLNKLEGIQKVDASWEKQQVLIWADEKNRPSEEEITKRIKKANFTPGEKIQPNKKDEE